MGGTSGPKSHPLPEHARGQAAPPRTHASNLLESSFPMHTLLASRGRGEQHAASCMLPVRLHVGYLILAFGEVEAERGGIPLEGRAEPGPAIGSRAERRRRWCASVNFTTTTTQELDLKSTTSPQPCSVSSSRRYARRQTSASLIASTPAPPVALGPVFPCLSKRLGLPTSTHSLDSSDHHIYLALHSPNSPCPP